MTCHILFTGGPLKLDVEVVGWEEEGADAESRTLGRERGVREMYEILNDIVARHRQG